jgi:hypothetical protein
MRIGQEMRDSARELAAGGIDFDAFARRTRGEWRRIALWLFRRWPTPAAVLEEDVEQQLLLSAWRVWSRRPFDPSRSASPSAYLVWNAIAKTTTWLHGQRGAGLHRPEKRPSNIAVPASWLDDPERGAAFLDGVAGKSPPADVRLGQARAARAIAAACSPATREVLDILASVDGDLALGAEAVYADPSLRVSEWLASEAAAVRLVDRAISEARAVVSAA